MTERKVVLDTSVLVSCPGRKLHPSPWLSARIKKSSIIGRIGCRNQPVKRHDRPVFNNSRSVLGVNLGARGISNQPNPGGA